MECLNANLLNIQERARKSRSYKSTVCRNWFCTIKKNPNLKPCRTLVFVAGSNPCCKRIETCCSTSCQQPRSRMKRKRVNKISKSCFVAGANLANFHLLSIYICIFFCLFVWFSLYALFYVCCYCWKCKNDLKNSFFIYFQRQVTASLLTIKIHLKW